MVVKYPSFVNVEEIIETPSNSSKYRYVLEIPFNNCNLCPAVIIILKNPSTATAKDCDVTISKVCNATHNAGYGKAIIFNLFPIRSTDPENVYLEFIAKKNVYEKHMGINYEHLMDKIDLTDDVIFAWGTNTIKHRTREQYLTAQKEVKKICNNKNLLMVAGGKNEPLHGQRWSNTSAFIKYDEYM